MARMMIISDDALTADTWQDDHEVLYLDGDADPDDAVTASAAYKKIMICFAGTHDGRGFSLARQLRDAGYKGHLRAMGALVPDQWRHLKKTGFNDIALTADQLEKMPIDTWDETKRYVLPDYQHRLMRK